MFKLLLLTTGISYEALIEHDAILSCPDFQISEELQELSVELTLTFREWKKIIGSGSRSNLSSKIISQIRAALDFPETRSFETDDIPF